MKTSMPKQQEPDWHCGAEPAVAVRRYTFIKLWLLGVASGMFVFQSAQAQSTLPFYEPFPSTYVENEQLGAAGSSGVIWTFGNGVSTSSGRIRAAAALSYPGLVTAADSLGLYGPPSGGTSPKSRAATFTFQTNTTVYASFLLNLQVLPSANRLVAGLSSDSGTGGNSVGNLGAGVFVDTSGRLLLSKNSTTTPSPSPTYALALNTTYLVVFRYKSNPGTGDDEAALWLNPTSLGNNNSIPSVSISTTNGTDRTELRSFGCMGPVPIFAYYMDEIRVGLSWADVTTPSCSPGTAFNVTGGGTVCAGSGFKVGLSGSQAGVDYSLYVNGVATGVSMPGTGAAIDFGTQTLSGLYTVLAVNSATSCAGWMNGAVTVALLASPTITTPPISVTAVAGSAATFSVVAGGDGLTYQWRRDGTNLVNGNNISGATTENLTIAPVNAADAVAALHGYDVVISGTCNPGVTSAPVALTLKAQSNLIWAGDGGLNLWDVAVSQDWIENNNPAFFNYGDRVTFDDSSANLSVTLASSFLSSASIKVTGINNYTFTGTGRIFGPNTSLLMDGSGTLTLNANNAYGGGTTISNGTVTITTGTALGTGPVTLAGGMLDSANAQITLDNDINVTADSTLQIRNTSTSALTLNSGSIGGSAGMLTLRNGTTASPTVRLNAAGITFNPALNLDLGAAGTGLLLACYNTNGAQTFNGVISGGGGLQRRSQAAEDGSGDTILNGANTYSGGMLLRDGGIGFGSSSITAFPPAIDSSPLGTGTLTLDTNSPGYMRLYAVGGARTVANPITYLGPDVGLPLVITGTNDLKLSGSIDLAAGIRTFRIDNTAKTIFSGEIMNGGLIKTGPGVLYLNGINSYVDPTTVSEGTLAGTGILYSPVTIQSGATLSAGSSIGTLTINSDLTIRGNVAVEVNKSLSPSSDFVIVNGILANLGTGTVSVVNLGPALAVGDKFTLFSQAVINGSALTVTGSGVSWINNLQVDGSISVQSVSTQKPVITAITVNANNLVFSGTNGTAGGNFYVLSSTNVAAPPTAWTRESTNSFGPGGAFTVTVPITTGTPQKFYLLQLP
jgi:autotransporter-associated beta strand protein